MLRLLRSAKTSFLAALLVLLLLPSEQLTAHRPIFTTDLATSPSTAIRIAEPEISQVVYREITKDSPQVWLTFSVPADFELFAQIGVPVIDRLKEFRPAMVVVGPWLVGKGTLRDSARHRSQGADDERGHEAPSLPRALHRHRLLDTARRDRHSSQGWSLLSRGMRSAKSDRQALAFGGTPGIVYPQRHQALPDLAAEDPAVP